jgi:hypothetical protein
MSTKADSWFGTQGTSDDWSVPHIRTGDNPGHAYAFRRSLRLAPTHPTRKAPSEVVVANIVAELAKSGERDSRQLAPRVAAGCREA